MKSLSTKSIHTIYTILLSATLAGMESKAKFDVIKDIRLMKPIADDFDSFSASAKDKLKGKDHDQMCQLAAQWQKEGDATTLTIEQRVTVNAYFAKYGDEINTCIDEEAKKQHELDIRTISESDFAKLIEVNDRLTVEQILLLQDCLC